MPAPSTQPDRPLQVLVVDDDPASRSLICEQIEQAGHTCLMAPHGRAALDILAASQVDLVTLDLDMPVMDGWELRRRMLDRAGFAQVRAVVVSNHRTIDPRPLKVEAIIEKPVQPDRLLALLDS